MFTRFVLISAFLILLISIFFLMPDKLSKSKTYLNRQPSQSSSDISFPTQRFADLIFKNPGLQAAQFSIGLTIAKRPISAYKLGSGNKKIILIGGIHTGKEKNTISLTNQILEHFLKNPNDLPSNLTLIIIPNANPDGIALNSHNNANGVDLNRNWPAKNWQASAYHPQTGRVSGGSKPLSEPETKALWNLIKKEKPILVIAYHSKAAVVEDNNVGIADKAAAIYSRFSGYKKIGRWPHYPISGQMIDAAGEADIAAFDVELSSRTDSELNQNLKALKQMILFLTKS